MLAHVQGLSGRHASACLLTVQPPLNQHSHLWLLVRAQLQLKAAVDKATKERAELQAMVQQAATELEAAQQQLSEGGSQQVGRQG